MSLDDGDSSLFFEIKIKNLDEVIKESSRHPFFLRIKKDNFWYPNSLPKLPALNSCIDELSLSEYVYDIGINAMMPKTELPIHIDTGPFEWSLNIPVYSFTDSNILFYKTEETPVLKRIKNNPRITYLGFESENTMTPYKEISGDSAMLLNVRKPHKVTNFGNKTRIMILIRLKNSFDIKNYLDK